MARRLPPFAAVRAFEAAARHCNLRLAGGELCLSISAVSHQVKSLESYLGVQLFHRTQNALELTPAGHSYMTSLAEALDLIASATARIEAVRNTTSISISLFPSLAVLWLMPRLSTFYELHSQVEVNVQTSIEPVSFRTSATEMAIRYEALDSPSPDSILLFKEKIYPVCAPHYADANDLFDPQVTFGNITVIHCATSPNEWDDWFRDSSVAAVRPSRVLNVDNRALALQAAQSGLGVAMGRTPFTHMPLANGALCRLTSRTVLTGFGYTLCLSDVGVRNPAVKAFGEWLGEQGKQSEE